MSQQQWFLSNGDWRHGPLTLEGLVGEILELGQTDQLLVWREGMESWTSPHQVAEVATRLSPVALPAEPVNPVPAAPPVLAPPSMSGEESGVSTWFLVGSTKLVVMSVATFGLYHVYWFYKQWQKIKESGGERILPVARAIFAVFFCHSLFNRMIESARKSGVPAPASAGGYSVAFILLSLSWRLPDPVFLIGFLSVMPLVAMQRVASAATLNALPDAGRNTRFTPVNWAGIVLGVTFWVLVGIGLAFPDGFENRASREFLSNVAAEVNKSLPKTIDAETELTETAGLEGVFVYTYRLVNYAAFEIDREKFEGNIRSNVTKVACATPQTRDDFLNRGVVLRYVFRSRDQKVVASFDVSSRDCGS